MPLIIHATTGNKYKYEKSEIEEILRSHLSYSTVNFEGKHLYSSIDLDEFGNFNGVTFQLSDKCPTCGK